MEKRYPEKRGNKYATVRIPRGQIEEIESFLETDFAKKQGYHYRVEVVSDAVRKFLEKYQPRLKHLNMVDDNVKIVDFEKNRVATLQFRNPGGVHCDLCDTDHCEHIDYALAQEDVQKDLEKQDWHRKRAT